MSNWNLSELRKYKKILFFDLGANVGKFTQRFTHKLREKSDLTGYLFEPNPKTYSRILEYKWPNYVNVEQLTFLNKLAWIDNTQKKVLIGTNPGSTNTMIAEIQKEFRSDKKRFKKNKEPLIESVDISRFILEKYDESFDYVVVKMDIEGSEWKVIEKMISDNTFKIVDDFLVEYHGPNKEERQNTINKLIHESSDKIKIYRQRSSCYQLVERGMYSYKRNGRIRSN